MSNSPSLQSGSGPSSDDGAVLQGKKLIGNAVSEPRGATFSAINPATGETLEPVFYNAMADHIERALEAAAAAFLEYQNCGAEQRAMFLERIATELEAPGDELVERASAETALPIARLTGERGRTTQQLRMFASLLREGSWVNARIDHGNPARQPPKPDLRRMLIPIGPVVVFGASNFPLAFSVPGGDTASALAAGNPVVVKAHPAHPGTSELAASAIARAAKETGVPPGVFSLLHGGPETGMALVAHPLTEAVGFTGSLRAGRAIFNAAAAREKPIPVYAEMGSVNPMFLLPGAVRERGPALAAAIRTSVTLGVGQFCTNPGLVFGTDGGELREVIERMARLFEETPPGTMLYPNLCQNFGAGVARLQQTQGVKLEGRTAQEVLASRGQAPASLFSTSASVFLKRPELEDELFGPSTLVVACESTEKMLEAARHLQGQLTATVHGTETDLRDNWELLRVLQGKVGRLIINGFPTGVEVSPAMQHGGPYPSTTDVRSTSVGTAAIERFARPLCWQDFPDELLPPELQENNPRGIWRLVDAEWTR